VKIIFIKIYIYNFSINIFIKKEKSKLFLEIVLMS
jgi:hypothetical protein